MPLTEVRPGMKGYGLTVFRGSTIERFDVEVVSVLPKAYLGESLVKQKREAEALPLYEKLVSEFERSEYLVEAQRRIAELKQAQSKPTGG